MPRLSRPFTATLGGLVAAALDPPAGSSDLGIALTPPAPGYPMPVDGAPCGNAAVLTAPPPSDATYNGTITIGIALTGTSQNPATIGAGGYVTNTTTHHGGDAIYGGSAAA